MEPGRLFHLLAWSDGRSSIEAILAADAASKHDWVSASGHAGSAGQAMLPAGEWLMPTKVLLQEYVRYEAALTVGVVGVELYAHYKEGIEVQAEAQKRKSDNQELAFSLRSRIAELEKKRSDVRNLVEIIGQEPPCK